MRLLEQVETLKQERRDLEAERQKVIEESTAAKLEKIDERSREIQNALHDLHRQCSSAKSASQPSQRKELELTEAIIKSQHDERHSFADVAGCLPARYIRSDAVEFFRSEVDRKQAELDELMKPFRDKPQWKPGPRIIGLRNDIEALKREWDISTEKLCRVGEKVAELREQRKSLTAEREQLRELREEAVIEKAKVA